MSRTYRRKNLKPLRYNYNNSNEFNHIKQLYDSGNPFPEQHRGWSGWLPEAPQELRDHREAEDFERWCRGKHTFAEFIAHEDAMFHSERGWHHHGQLWRGMGGEMNGDDRNIQFERPHRSAMKQFIHCCVTNDTWDGTVVPEYKSRGWWMYYN